ncbi:uncharacterized protein [Dermacentor albipictus]|uniref:uncharacterized protein n=1 Tax=Dermacentor albipictus TaxID=60249 RepID=UPI0031FC2DD1
MATHEAICGFRQVRCLFQTCGYVNSINDLPSHLALRHAASVMEVHEGTADVVLQDPTTKEHTTRVLLLLHMDHVFGVVYQRTGQFHSEGTLNIFSLTASADIYEYQIIIRRPAGTNCWSSRAAAPDAGEETAIGFTESFIHSMTLHGCLRLEIKLMKSVL